MDEPTWLFTVEFDRAPDGRAPRDRYRIFPVRGSGTDLVAATAYITTMLLREYPGVATRIVDVDVDGAYARP